MTARPHARSRRLSLPALLTLAALLPVAFASIGEAPSTIVDALASYQPVAAGGGFTAGSGFRFQVESASDIAVAVSGEGDLNDANVRFVSDLIGAASGYGQGIAAPAAQFLRTRAGDYAGKGPTAVGVEEFVLHLTVTGDAPYHLGFTLKPQTVDPSLFPPATHSRGPEDARHVIRVFSDFQCPFCKRFAEEVMPELQAKVLDQGDVRFEFHDFPLTSIHPNAMTAAEAAECVTAANDPAAFWTYHDALFASQSDWANLPDPVDALVTVAADAGLKTDGVSGCVRNGTYSDSLAQALQAAGQGLHLTGTPTIFVDDLKVGDYTKMASYTRLFALSDALRSEAPAASGGGAAPASSGSAQ
ncbi:MAG TPA: DsbA family protein [Trueperaceae bacterium]|nr:DsbA family protein [Trueperaceae bacterium]